MKLVLRPFPASDYFFGRNSGIYFSVPTKIDCYYRTPTTDCGGLQLKYFDGSHIRDIGKEDHVVPADMIESPFFSFSSDYYHGIVLPEKGVGLVVDRRSEFEKLYVANKSYLALTAGPGIDGPFYCGTMRDSVFLPGDRYFLFNTPGCSNNGGQLLIDTRTGKYERVPPRYPGLHHAEC